MNDPFNHLSAKDIECIIVGFKNNLKEQRNELLKETDKYLLPDYPISSTNLDLVKQYRKDLRNYMNIPEIINFNSNTPIPKMPSFPIFK